MNKNCHSILCRGLNYSVNFFICMYLLMFSSFLSHGQGKPSTTLQKVSKQEATQLITAFKEKNSGATIYGQTVTKAQLEELIQMFPDCNAFSVYVAIDKTGNYTGANQYMLLLAPAKFNAENNSIQYVNDPGHDSSLYMPTVLCPNECGLMQNQGNK